jgi:hypothetical protein
MGYYKNTRHNAYMAICQWRLTGHWDTCLPSHLIFFRRHSSQARVTRRRLGVGPPNPSPGPMPSSCGESTLTAPEPSTGIKLSRDGVALPPSSCFMLQPRRPRKLQITAQVCDAAHLSPSQPAHQPGSARSDHFAFSRSRGISLLRFRLGVGCVVAWGLIVD